MERKVARVLKKLEGMRGLSLEERILFARSLAATPDERWRLHENFLRLHTFSVHSRRKAFKLKS